MKFAHHLYLVAGIAGMAGLAAAPAVAGAIVENIAIAGQATSTDNGTYKNFSGVELNNNGQAAFKAWGIQGTANGAADDSGIFLGNANSTTEILREGDDAPTHNGTISDLTNFYSSTLSLNNNNQVALRTLLDNTTGGSADNLAILRGSPASVDEMARKGDSPGYPYGTTLQNLGSPSLNESGSVTFSGVLSGTTGGYSDDEAAFIVYGPSNSPQAVTRESYAAPDGNGTVGSFGSVKLNDAYQSAFVSSYMDGTTGGTDDNQGLFLHDDNGLSQIARTGDAAPDGNGEFDAISPDYTLNNNGKVAFFANLRNTALGLSDNYGLFFGDGDTLTEVAREGDIAPDGNGKLGNLYDVALNDAGQIAFDTDGMTDTLNGDAALYRWDNGSLTQIVREGDAAPDGNGEFGYIDSLSIAAGGQVAFRNRGMHGTAGGTSDNDGIFISDGEDTIQLSRLGDNYQGSVIDAFYDVSDVNDRGQVAVNGRLADGRGFISLLTPDLHWRRSSGQWDTSDNWTLGLDPDAPHNVYIAPASNVYIDGPSDDTTIRSLQLGGNGGSPTLRLNQGGDLSVTETLNVQNGTLQHDNGTLHAGNVRNNGRFLSNGGTLTVSGEFRNLNYASIAGVASTTDGFSNLSSMVLDGGSLFGGPVTNEFGATMSARGTVGATFNNNGTLNVAGPLSVNGAMTNLGTVNAGTGDALLANGSLTNFGTVDLNGGAVSGIGLFSNMAVIRGHGAVSAEVQNAGGLIDASDGGTMLTITNFAGNIAGGELRIADDATMGILSSFSSSGTVHLQGEGAVLMGGDISNSGTIRGAGRVQNAIANSGNIRAEGGDLTLSGAGLTNTASGVIETAIDTRIIASQGLAENYGTIALSGGRFDNNGNALHNASGGIIGGQGTLATGGLTNNGHLSFANGGGNVIGSVANNANTDINDATVTFFDDFTNNGTLTSNRSTVNFLGAFVNNGALVTDPNTMNLTDFVNNDPAYVQADAGDTFNVSNDVLGDTSSALQWQTDQAILRFVAGDDDAHNMQLYGLDMGVSYSGLVNNFGWGTMELTSDQTLSLADVKDDGRDGALYLDQILLAGLQNDIVGGVVQTIFGNGFNIYYDPLALGNAYLNGDTYGLLGGGQLIALQQEVVAAPEPGALSLFLLGVIGLGIRRRRRFAAT